MSIGTKGEMIRKTKQELGSIASKMWKDAKVVGADGRNILAVMRMSLSGGGLLQLININSESQLY